MGVRVLCFLGLLMGSHPVFGQTILFEDNFSKQEESKWSYVMQGTGAFKINNGIELAISGRTSKDTYSNSTIVSKSDFLKKNLIVQVVSSPMEKGSRGWGYWNGEMDPTKSAIAWFIYLEGDANYPLNGFFVMVQGAGNMPELIPMNVELMRGKHEYTISWSDSLKFKVDGIVVATSTQNILANMAIHIWQDNAVYDTQTFTPVLQALSGIAPTTISQVQVTD